MDLEDNTDQPEVNELEQGPSAQEAPFSPEDIAPLLEEDYTNLALNESLKDLNAPLADNNIYSLISGTKVYYERLPMLEVVVDRFIRLSTTSLRNFSGDNVEIFLDDITSVRFGEYISTLPTPSMVNVFVVEEWDNQGILTADVDIIYSMIDVLLGGRTGNAPMALDGRYFTTIEQSLVERMVHILFADLSAAFDPLCPVTLRLDRMETNPKFATISHPTNTCILVRLSIRIENRGGAIELLIPYATLEPIREILLQNYLGEKFGRDSIWENHLVKQINNTNFELSAVLDELTLPLSEVLNWKEGSVVLLNATPASLIKVLCHDETLFQGYMGQKAGNLAIKVDHIIRHEEV